MRIKFALFITIFLLLNSPIQALECGTFTFPKCYSGDVQYDNSFDPKTGYGGFGGGACVASKTPVIFIHGNGDRAINWASSIDGKIRGCLIPSRSVYDEFKYKGYNDCELFGISYLSPDEQKDAAGNFHKPEKYKIIYEFIQAVKAYTGKDKVDIVAHSLGVSMTIATLTRYQSWNDVRRFINIAGGIRGLNVCLVAGPSNPMSATCGSGNIFNSYIFGFYPDSPLFPNPWTASTGVLSLRHVPEHHLGTWFYTLSAGLQDEIHCTTVLGWNDCKLGAIFNKSPNVKSQLNIGAGFTSSRLDWDLTDGSMWNKMGGDTNGIGHFKVRNNSGQIIYMMLTTDCEGLACKNGYKGPVIDE